MQIVKNKINSYKNINTLKLLVVILIVLAIVLIVFSNFNEPADTACSDTCEVVLNRSDTCKVSKYTEDVNVISFEDSLNYIDGTAVLYYSFDDCPWCYDGFPVFKEVANTYDIEWYYVNTTRNERTDDNPTYLKLLNIFSSECEGKIYMPFTVFIKDGKIIGSNTGTVSSHQTVNGKLPVINSKQKEELKQIYIKLFEKLKYKAEI